MVRGKKKPGRTASGGGQSMPVKRESNRVARVRGGEASTAKDLGAEKKSSANSVEGGEEGGGRRKK